MPHSREDETRQLAEQMTPVHWEGKDKVLFSGILLLLVANLVVGILTLGPDLWG